MGVDIQVVKWLLLESTLPVDRQAHVTSLGSESGCSSCDVRYGFDDASGWRDANTLGWIPKVRSPLARHAAVPSVLS